MPAINLIFIFDYTDCLKHLLNNLSHYLDFITIFWLIERTYL